MNPTGFRDKTNDKNTLNKKKRDTRKRLSGVNLMIDTVCRQCVAIRLPAIFAFELVGKLLHSAHP